MDKSASRVNLNTMDIFTYLLQAPTYNATRSKDRTSIGGRLRMNLRFVSTLL